MKCIRLACLSAALLAVALGAAPAEAQAMKIGVFDPQRVSEETVEGKRIQQALGSLRDTKAADIKSRQEAIQAVADQIQQQGLSMSADRRTQLEVELQQKQLELDNARKLATQELQLQVQAAQVRFEEQLRVAIEQFARQGGYDLILDTTVVSFGSPQVDITTGIIDAFDKVSAAMAAQPAGQP